MKRYTKMSKLPEYWKLYNCFNKVSSGGNKSCWEALHWVMQTYPQKQSVQVWLSNKHEEKETVADANTDI